MTLNRIVKYFFFHWGKDDKINIIWEKNIWKIVNEIEVVFVFEPKPLRRYN